MPLYKRPTDRMRLVCVHDEALDELPDTVIREYLESNRDWKKIEPHLRDLNTQPTVFTCEPLKPAYDGVGLGGAIDDFKRVFATHVVNIENIDPEMAPRYISLDKVHVLESAWVDSIPISWVLDIAGAVIKVGSGDTSPFSLPDGYWLRRHSRKTRRHVIEGIARMAETATPENGNPVTPS